MGNQKTRVLFASANAEVLQMLGRVARNEPGVTIVAEAENAIEATALGGRLRPDVVVVDAELPHVSTAEGLRLSRIGGLDTAISIRRELNHSAVVVLSSWRDTVGQGSSGQANVELSLYRETLAGSSRIKLGELSREDSQQNTLVFAGLVARGTPPGRSRVVAASDKAIPLSVLAIIGGLALMLTIIMAAAGAVLALGGAVALAVSIVVRAAAARWPEPHADGQPHGQMETEKLEAESHAVKTRA